jgi:hypothetical protein
VKDYPPVLSFGGGVNSTALAILLIDGGWSGELVFCDTGCEWPETYCYMTYFEAEWLRPRGFSITRLKGYPWHRVHHGITLLEYCQQGRLIPMAGVRWCTIDWKVRPLERYAAGREQMIGIAADESRRKPTAVRPLVDLGIDRMGCVEIIRGAGLDVPRKSGCYICPFMIEWQWRELWVHQRELFDVALALEQACQARRPERRVTLDVRGTISLLDRKARFETQTVLPGVDLDEFREWQPCNCTL